MGFRRGFKSQCERRSVEFRKDLGLAPSAPLSAFNLAKHLGITVWSTSEIEDLSEDDLANLNDPGDDSWSALTIQLGAKHLVIYKNVASQPRINSVVMHEISHIVLGHELSDACVLGDGSLVPRNFSQEQEDEADWLGGTLLLPRPALLEIRRSRLTDAVAQTKFNVSVDMLRWRVRMTGVDYQLNRVRRSANS